MSDYFHSDLDGEGICTLTIDQPGSSANVMDQTFLDSFRAHIEGALDDANVTGIILTSAKKTFVGGADLKAMERSLSQPKQADDLYAGCWRFSSLLRRMETAGTPVVAALNGTALGGGFEIALACHYRLAVNDRKMVVGLPEVGVGLLPGAGGTQRYLRLLGVAKALPLLLQGKQLKAAEALEAGLLHELTDSATLLDAAKRWLRERADPVQPWDRKKFRIPGGNSIMQPDMAQLFMGTAANLQANTFHNMPAPRAIACCLYEGFQLPMDTALRVECKYFVQLNLDPVAGNMVRTAFVNKTRADNLIRRPSDIPKATHQRIGVLGAGLMGAGIAHSAARAGLDVILIDRDQASSDKGKAHVEKRLDTAVSRGRINAQERDAIRARIHPTSEYDGLGEASLVVEAVFEDRDVKAQVYAQAEAVLADNAILASNTSALPITGLAETTGRAAQFIGLHFFSPVDRMPLVEVIRGAQTSDRTLAHALDLVAQLRKTPILVNDNRGFFTSRFFGAFLNEGLTMVAEGVAPALIENAAKHLGYPVGPLSISDEVGLDLAQHGARQAREDLGDDYEPGSSAPIIDCLVTEHERHGRKNGKGFYDYAADGSKQLWPGLASLWPPLPASQQPGVEQVQNRMLYAQLADAAHCLADNVLTAPADGDIGACFGVGFPLYMGGPFCAMDTRGIGSVVAHCDALAQQVDGRRYAVPDLLRRMARDNQTFYGDNALALPVA